MLFDVKLFKRMVDTHSKELNEFIRQFDSHLKKAVKDKTGVSIQSVREIDDIEKAFAKAKVGERFSIRFPRSLYFEVVTDKGEEILVIGRDGSLHFRDKVIESFVTFHMHFSSDMTLRIMSLSDAVDNTVDDTLSKLLGVPVRVPKNRIMKTRSQAVEEINSDATLASLFYKGLLKDDTKLIIDVFKSIDPKVGWIGIGDDEFFVYPFSDEIGDGKKRYPISKLM